MRMKAIGASLLALGAALTSATAVALPAQAVTTVAGDGEVEGLLNASSIGLGFSMRAWPSSGNYDRVLFQGESTEANVTSVYIGPGYCAQRWIGYTDDYNIQDVSKWTRAGSDFPSGKYHLSGDYYVKIVAYKAYSSSRCVAP